MYTGQLDIPEKPHNNGMKKKTCGITRTIEEKQP
jgi:hypothetical protein